MILKEEKTYISVADKLFDSKFICNNFEKFKFKILKKKGFNVFFKIF